MARSDEESFLLDFAAALHSVAVPVGDVEARTKKIGQALGVDVESFVLQSALFMQPRGRGSYFRRMDFEYHWNLRRMALIDRNILRMAVYEMLHLKDIPAKVSINEAIEMGKRFSTQQSGAFINGILDRIRREKGL